MYNLYQDPMGEKVFKDDNPSHKTQPDITGEHHSIAMRLSGLTAVKKVNLLDAPVKAPERVIVVQL